MINRRYSVEFKAEAVKQVVELGVRVKEVSERARSLDKEPVCVAQGGQEVGSWGEMRRENVRLKSELKRVEKERDILKKAAGKITNSQLRSLLSSIASFVVNLRIVTPGKKLSICRDAEDGMVLECCLAAGADFLIAGDKDLLEIPAECSSLGDVSTIRLWSKRSKPPALYVCVYLNIKKFRDFKYMEGMCYGRQQEKRPPPGACFVPAHHMSGPRCLAGLRQDDFHA